ncbi:hypothetical protein A2954_04925 [Candidatus Roizmanbacteria bacterium RIFCSPLOWO2_01_FULL_37_12]|uniref:Uncharacterized protein n=1 Tax=Candidatus Roizmanbacteria bacterium RIFCSPLOWO2_01_FULL_37_12 TaxID=1802056 RepID=A0A1F7I8Q1_9BACT|nr:MAG: hypothetical protein A2768_02015 [Candidatus Roizmanbacteria bacterium RIFCSPHIGHO2_01_FULL_37_16]OGK23702.1 MAG: hypothetical protein A3D76_03965 [Candidatus Roizmanbacteria bacterium RIFCSPHIGHO2_02_FULL_37_9b]OGK39740.1 MAG: hypothetical protein A2954_04925 [Candidatus Roizmanbacteria bacterium RIFCSPLOWO2_01_FULL_37_12]
MKIIFTDKLKTAFKTFLFLFGLVHIINIVLLYLVGGFWDGGLSIGFPKAFYIINCGFRSGRLECPIGFNFFGLFLNLSFWYFVAFIIKIFQKTNSFK